MSDWPVRRVGDLVRQRKDVVVLQPGIEYRTMGVRWYGKGAYDRGIGTTATIKATRLWRAHAGDFVFNRIDTQNGAFDVVPPELDGALVTNEFPTYAGLPGVVDERFLLAYFQQRSVQDAIGLVRAGSEGRARWKETDFEAWTLALPPLSEQQRIVAVMRAVDVLGNALEAEAEAAHDVLSALGESLLSERPGADRTRLGDCVDIEVGFAFKSDQFLDHGPGTRLLRGDNISPGAVRWTGAKIWPEAAVVDRRRYGLSVGDVVVGMDRTWIKSGLRVAVVGTDDVPSLLVQRVARLRAKNGTPQALVRFLVDSASFRRMVLAQQKGTSVPHISAKQIAEHSVWLPRSKRERAEIALALAATASLWAKYAVEVAALRAVRADLLDALLSQEITIDAAVDKFVTAA